MKNTPSTVSKIETSKKKKFSTGALRHENVGKGMPSLVSPIFEDELAKHCESGCLAGYAPHNWEKGVPLSRTFDAIQRHTREVKEGLTNENHMRAAAWNWMVFIHTKEMIRRGLLPKELDDMPKYVAKKCPKHRKHKKGCDICQMIIDNK